MLLQAESVLFPDADQAIPGWIEVANERIAAVGIGRPPRPAERVLEGLVVPGYVDVHSHGGGGASFVTTDPAQVRTVLASHAAVGTTTMVASLVTAPVEDLLSQLAMLAELYRSTEIAGVHLEGPWLALGAAGAHPPELLRDPEPAMIEQLLVASDGALKMVTMAPERGGALSAIRTLTGAGVVVAVGHTEADFETTISAIEAGATGATHLFNAMPPLRSREPGPVLALWADQRVVLEVIFDGVHQRSELAAFVMRTAAGRVALVTDAMAAAGAKDGDYLLGELEVVVSGGVARLAGKDNLAGSTLTLDRAVRNAVAAGIPVAQAVQAATQVPADYLGLAEVGRLSAGKLADLVVLDDQLQVAAVMRRGAWL